MEIFHDMYVTSDRISGPEVSLVVRVLTRFLACAVADKSFQIPHKRIMANHYNVIFFVVKHC